MNEKTWREYYKGHGDIEPGTWMGQRQGQATWTTSSIAMMIVRLASGKTAWGN